MITQNCLFDWHVDNIKNSCVGLTDKEITDMARKNILRQCELFPAFPELELVVGISGQKYEKMDCFSNMAFLPEQYCGKISLDTEFENPVPMSEKKLRTIRKLLESVDTEHCLVFQKNNNNYHEAIGIANKKEITSKLVTLIELRGHMVWRAYISTLPIFEYKNGNFFSITEKFNKDNLEKAIKNTFENSLKKVDEPEKVINKWLEIVANVSNSNHGTSIVILTDNYDFEVKRLTDPKCGHGIKLKEFIDFTNQTEMEKYLSQATRIDGGLLINFRGECHAIGCIFDGVVFSDFEGDSGRGSRYNSVKLYVKQQENNKFECMGIIVSDDGTVDIISR